MIVNVYYIAINQEAVERNPKLFRFVYKKSYAVGIQRHKEENLVYVACRTKEKRNEDYLLWKKYFNSTILVFKEGITKLECLGEEGKPLKELDKD